MDRAGTNISSILSRNNRDDVRLSEIHKQATKPAGSLATQVEREIFLEVIDESPLTGCQRGISANSPWTADPLPSSPGFPAML